MGSHHPIRKTVAPEPVAIPDRLYFRIGDVARLCAVAPYVLRFWETEFPQLKPNKGGTGQRLYRKKDVETALRIKSLLYDHGYTIAGARQALRPDAQSAAQPIAEAPAAEPIARPILHEVPAEPHDRGAELRLRAQLADLRDEIQSLITLLNQPFPGAPPQIAPQPAPQPAPAPEPAVQLFRPRLVLEPRAEPKPAPKPAHATTLHIAQGDLFSAE
jgi:DNA-binding transcriptional MerR regulator